MSERGSTAALAAGKTRSESARAVSTVENRARHFGEFISGLGDDLVDGIDTQTATDLLWASANAELWRELVEERGWSPDRYEQWLAATLVAQLIEAPTVGRSRRRTNRR